MNLMQEWLARAAEELAIRVVIGYAVTLSDGRRLTSQALFPDFGSPFGTLVFRFQDLPNEAARRELVAQGYGMSTFSEPLPHEDFDVDSYAEMFSEWGWTSAEAKRPAWLVG